ncbi:uncharacterized protein MELLADRAFT_88739 [Melampsora larici-populina 98AG31]|uniref:DUF4211 domain-containing protein n=1 Tax=Melampsora larici-populina (strain 98AG31 / pathotype 3-4-7) TaxID=747676 RepID=F4RST5_MELLP|nr:uncharacterized protein MELLADRAFT_88739 [Melampsora larici-populina 98AG31]EGG04551.1 hypothetical protein MELLADRAFT_88739 [Melampsora larici-populina 98AG31]
MSLNSNDKKDCDLCFIVKARPDLNCFKPPDSILHDKAYWDEFLTPVNEECPSSQNNAPHNPPTSPPESIENPTSGPSSELSHKKRSKRRPSSKANRGKPKRRASLHDSDDEPIISKARHKPTKSKRRTLSESSDNEDDVDDLFLSDYSEPETKLRSKNELNTKYSKFRKNRHVHSQKRAMTKEVLSRRIVPDSEDEDQTRPALEPSGSESTSEEESSTDDSLTDKDEIAKRDAEFIVNDMADKAKAVRIQKQLAANIPTQFQMNNLDDLGNFKLVCRYLLNRIFLPHTNWWKRASAYRQSYARISTAVIGPRISLLDSAAWIPVFRQALQCRPRIIKSLLNQHRVGCDACNNRTKHSTFTIILNGHKYHNINLDRISSDSSSESSDDSDAPPTKKFRSANQPDQYKFICGQDCATKAFEFHHFKPMDTILTKIIENGQFFWQLCTLDDIGHVGLMSGMEI